MAFYTLFNPGFADLFCEFKYFRLSSRVKIRDKFYPVTMIFIKKDWIAKHQFVSSRLYSNHMQAFKDEGKTFSKAEEAAMYYQRKACREAIPTYIREV